MNNGKNGHPVRVGVVGVGYVGHHHARIYSELPNVELVGVVDIDDNRLHEVGQRHQVRLCRDYRELMKRVDAVSVAVPTLLHYPIAKEFLECGVDVLVEKPIAQYPAQADELVEIARDDDRIFQVGHSERFNGAVKALRTVVRNPGFIECHRLGPFAHRNIDVDVVLDLMIHDIDIVLNLIKSPVTEVTAVGVPVISDQVDIANARLQFESGCVANLTASRVSVERVRRVRIFQRDTVISLDYSQQEIAIYHRIPGTGGTAIEAVRTIVREDIVIDKAEPLRVELESFIECVRTRKRPLVSGEEGRDALKVASQIVEQL
ncbi:MAG: UDP-N-acetyl-D-glucosamine dehydrogenase [Candidatus Methylomirabilota bacterium]|nr:Gfo/Idh/MocA family oxidoreductase [Candidatus Methylomirabilis sp.]NJD68354.1 Gfo/Idh/MocA family oxidoreductase [candidate division NC10 bacterium]PWB43940.1 MAG: UDP-N-acetyl-D-glucosamine dehydrogenase [candidate division NC10 bacterium]